MTIILRGRLTKEQRDDARGLRAAALESYEARRDGGQRGFEGASLRRDIVAEMRSYGADPTPTWYSGDRYDGTRS